MDLMKKHIDTVIIIGAIISSVLWMNTKFNSLEKDILVIKTVLIMKNILPTELAIKESTLDKPSS